jgi:uncharacterized membrane protein
MGGWDAVAIWNAKARVILEGGDIWATEHPDYPLLLPFVIALLWRVLGNTTAAAPAGVSIAFGAATVLLLISAVRRHRSGKAAVASGCVMLTSPFFVTQSAAQYADIPLGFFMLASLARLDAPLLAGALAGFASCVKNEGLLFLLVLTLTLLVVRRQALPRFLLGAAPALMAVLYFKLRLAPANDLFRSQDISTLVGRLTNPARYGQIATALAIESLNVLLWGAGTIAALLTYLLFTKPRFCEGQKWQLTVISATLSLMLLGFISAYLITPWDLGWHLATSTDRLVLQLWPSVIFLFFLVARSPRHEALN